MKRIAILTAGSAGNVIPYIALALGLREAGHQVYLVTTDDHESLIRQYELDFCSIEGNDNHVVPPGAATGLGNYRAAITQRRWNFLNTIWGFMATSRQGEADVEQKLYKSWFACQGADAIVASYLSYAAPHIAERLQIPCFWALLQPTSRTTAFPHFMTPYGLAESKFVNKSSHIIAENLMWWLTKRPINHWRQQQLGLPPLHTPTPYAFTGRDHLPVLFGFSPSVLPKPPDWGAHLFITGYWFLKAQHEWSPPSALADFLAAGPPPVLMSLCNVDQLSAEMALAALALTGQRSILITGGWVRVERKLSDQIFVLDWAPYPWLFPRTSAVVHHGGSGTVGIGLAANVPTITLPTITDQVFWGKRIARLGVAPSPIYSNELSASKLAEAITIGITDQRLRAKATALSRQMQAEDGVSRVIEIIEKHL